MANAWFMNTFFEFVPVGFVPAGATPLEDFKAKFIGVKYVVDPDTRQQKTYQFPNDVSLGVVLNADGFDVAVASAPGQGGVRVWPIMSRGYRATRGHQGGRRRRSVLVLPTLSQRSPEALTDEEVQAYLLHLVHDRKLAWATCSLAVNAFRFLYHVTLGRNRTDFRVPAPKVPQKLPEILSCAQGASGRVR